MHPDRSNPGASPPRFSFTYWEADALRGAIEACDALWDLDARRGLVKGGRGGAEYKRVSPAPRLRRLLDESTQRGGG